MEKNSEKELRYGLTYCNLIQNVSQYKKKCFLQKRSKNTVSAKNIWKRRAVIGDGGETRSPDIKINSEITTTKVATSVE